MAALSGVAWVGADLVRAAKGEGSGSISERHLGARCTMASAPLVSSLPGVRAFSSNGASSSSVDTAGERRWRPYGERTRSMRQPMAATRRLLVSSHALEAMEEDAIGSGSRRLSRRYGVDVSSFKSEDAPGRLNSEDGGKGLGLLPLPQLPRNRADDATLSNPLQRAERMGCGWYGIVMEWEGVIVEDDRELERRAWEALAEEEGKPRPPAFLLKRADGMKSEQVVSEVLCWGREFKRVKQLARRKEELYEEMQGGVYRVRDGSREFVELMQRHRIPVGIASTRPRIVLERAIEAVGMEGFFSVIISAEDCFRGKPDPEMYQYASERMGLIPERCIVIGNNNASVEAAHDALMKCIAVAGKHPMYELGAADQVVRRLTDLSIVDLKNLADLESPEFMPPEPIPELELQGEEVANKPKTAVMDRDDLFS